MIWWSRALVDLALTGYLWAAVQALTELGRRGLSWPVPTPALVIVAWALQTIGLGLRGVAFGGPPVGGLHAVLSFIVWAAVLFLLWAERRYALRALPAFVLAPVSLLALVAAAAPEGAVFGGQATGRAGHAFFIVLGLGALAVNFAGALMYVVQERALKRARLAGLSRRLPALDALDRFGFHTLATGFPFLTLGIVLGVVSAAPHGPGWLWQPTPLTALATWGLYAVTLYLRAAAGWGGHRAAYLTVAGFGGALVTVSVSLLLPTRHVPLVGP